MAANVRAARKPNWESGFGIVEVIVSMGVFAVLAVAFAMAMSSSLRTFQYTRGKTVGVQIANEALESVRALAYDDIGTIGGNPPGTVEPSSQSVVAGVTFTTEVSISFVNDPLPGGFQTYANYKRVAVTVTSSRSATPVASTETIVAPPSQPSLTSAIAKVQVVDYALNAPIEGATVTLGTGPSGPRTAVSAADGSVVFPDLQPNPTSGPQAFYDVAVARFGYEVLPEDVSPSPAAHMQLTAGQLFTTVIRLYKPATISVKLLDGAGGSFLGDASVTISSSRGSQTSTATGGSLVVAELDGIPVVPSLQYTVGAWSGSLFATAQERVVPDAYPNDLTSTFTLTLGAPSTAKIQVHVRDGSGNPIAGAYLTIDDGPSSVHLGATANNGGILLMDVPSGAQVYTVSFPAQGSFGTAQVQATVPGPGATVVTVTAPPA